MINSYPDQPNGKAGKRGALPVAGAQDAFEHPRDFLQNEFVYLVISSRARGLSVGINLNPVPRCTFNCLYCEVDRNQPPRAPSLDVNRMGEELRQTLQLARNGKLKQLPFYSRLSPDLLEVRHVALSGDGEPTLCKNFVEAVQAVVHLRAVDKFFKIVLITNSSALNQPAVLAGLKFLTRDDEIWAKLDGGTQDYVNRVNGSTVPLEKILDNILLIGRQRPVVIQSLFPAVDGVEPSTQDIREYAHRLTELKDAGAEISLVQIYSAARPMVKTRCSHLSLKQLSAIAGTVRKATGLNVEIF